MTMQASIEETLRGAMPLEWLEVVNESHNHARPGTQTHFKVTAVSPVFAGMGQVKRHQQLYALLSQQLQDGVHALALHTYTPQEWALRQGVAPASPDCMGGGH
ncbi:MAG: BolA/IbaG family iron-sulfur metabolism protein [Pseudomonadales bacterium]|nr:BolA/IbaG family iron-sulfur metabolism protein [Pseudomonadales bacterium]MCP5331029.1 BolA/IbaG family iron-sulfur metabolism protein [Pseudomonadales bacterium]MCP5343491.1 BolA/IbaG family iron-sulfur metabolism protein [Pseudomonadales bacterium]